MWTSNSVAPAASNSLMTRSISFATSRSPVTPTKRCRKTPIRRPLSVAESRPSAKRAADVAVGLGGCGIFGVGSGDVIERERDVAHRFGHRSDGVVVRIERHDAGAADQAAGDSDRGQRREPGWVRKRVAGVGAKRERGQTGGNCGRAAAARAGRAERRVVGVADRAADGADAEIAEGELVEICFAENDGAALPHAGGDPRIEARSMIDETRASRPWWEGRGHRCCL